LIRDLQVDSGGVGEWRIELAEESEKALLIVSAITPHTTELAGYRLAMDPVRNSSGE
jgi:hypothetical protein